MASVVIVGAGPAGATLAYLLARDGIKVTLLERQVDFAREFRGEGLMPSGVDAFEQMGLKPTLDSVPHAPVDAIDLYRGDRRLLRVSLAGSALTGLRMVSQPALLEMIVAEAARFPTFTLERGATARDLLREGGRFIGVTADTAAGPREFRAELVIGGDGRASILRRRADLSERRDPQIFDVVWFKVPAADFIPAGTMQVYLGRGHFALVFHTHGDQVQIAWIIEKGKFGELRRMGIDSWLEEMATHVSGDLARHLRSNRDALTHPFLLDVICDRLVNWTAPGLLLLGDAAHPMSPVGAQGINIALRDALVAANHLVPALQHDAASAELDEAARRVQIERLPEVAAIQSIQHAGPRLLFGKSIVGRVLLSAPFLALAGTRPFRLLLGPFVVPRFREFTDGVAPVKLRV